MSYDDTAHDERFIHELNMEIAALRAEVDELTSALRELLDATKYQPVDMFLRQRCAALAVNSQHQSTLGEK